MAWIIFVASPNVAATKARNIAYGGLTPERHLTEGDAYVR